VTYKLEKPSGGLGKTWVTAQAVIVGLVIKEALVQIYDNIEPSVSVANGFFDISDLDLSSTFLYFVFFLMLARFYMGAYRFGQIDESDRSFVSSIINFLGGCILFTFFFFMASSLGHPHSFIKYVFWLHLVDLVWFSVTILLCLKKGWKKKIKIASTFLLLTFSTIGALLFCSNVLNILIFLFIISIIDLLVLLPFYTEGDVRFWWEQSK